MIQPGVSAEDYIVDVTSKDKPRTYKIKHIDNVIVEGRMCTRFGLKGEGFRETRTISADEFIVLRIIEHDANFKIMTILFPYVWARSNHNNSIRVVASSRDLVEVNTIDLRAYDKRFPVAKPFKKREPTYPGNTAFRYPQ